MFNLIPKNLMADIKREYLYRKITVIMLFVIFIQIAFLVFGFPVWLISKYNQGDVELRADSMNAYLSSLNIASTTDSIKSINAKLSVIDKNLKYPEIVPFFDAILSQKTNSITINSLAYSSSDDKNAVIDISGMSGNREALLTFVKNLQGLGLFKSVDFPISNFTKDKNLDFSLNIKIEKK